jgi:phospholipid/cholesterol/gamma-HCH transport system substrate-binding protein
VRRFALLCLGGAVLAAVLLVIFTGGSSPYVVRVMLANAAGLRQRSPVMIGGVPAGTVTLHLGAGDQVIANLELNGSQAPVGKDASVAIAAVNFLGQKEAELTRGDLADPAPSGYVITGSHVSVATDLDQVLDVLDPSTRARLAILIDEAGTAFTGRKADFSLLLQQLPHSLTDANALLGQLVSDNHTLADLVTSSDQFVSQISAQRTQLGQLIGTVGQAAVTVAQRRQALSQTLARAPGTLSTLQSFLAKLKATTVPLGPAASNITAAAPPLTAALRQAQPFESAAAPALSSATTVAPALTRLASGATPVLVQANPVIGTLSTFSTALQPVSHTLNLSVDNLLAVVDNWSRAIEYRDGLSHVFRGAAGIGPDVLDSIIRRLLSASSASAHNSRATSTVRANHTSAPTTGRSASRPSQGQASSFGLGQQVQGVLGNATNPSPPPQSLSSLLNFLLKP